MAFVPPRRLATATANPIAPRQRKRPLNKEGIFDNAVFSKIVRAVDDPEVQRGVEEDLRWITRKPPGNDSTMWNHAAPPSSSRDDDQEVRMAHPGRGLTFLRKGRMEVRKMKRDRTPPLPPVREDPFAIFDRPSSEFVVRPHSPVARRDRTPPYRRQVEYEEEDEEEEVEVEDEEPDDEEAEEVAVHKSPPRKRAPQHVKLPSFAVPKTPPPVRHAPQRAAEQRRQPAAADEIPRDLLAQMAAKASAALPNLPMRSGNAMNYRKLVRTLCRQSLTEDQSSSSTSEPVHKILSKTFQEAARDHTKLMESLKPVDERKMIASESPFEVSLHARTPRQERTVRNVPSRSRATIDSPYVHRRHQTFPIYEGDEEEEEEGVEREDGRRVVETEDEEMEEADEEYAENPPSSVSNPSRRSSGSSGTDGTSPASSFFTFGANSRPQTPSGPQVYGFDVNAAADATGESSVRKTPLSILKKPKKKNADTTVSPIQRPRVERAERVVQRAPPTGPSTSGATVESVVFMPHSTGRTEATSTDEQYDFFMDEEAGPFGQH
ncbi:hypothetical protein M3Y99_01840400 [Aphelenchoides fujianensis]|nr:hypothetical protein M3Y99_01840400 [Aphelenchoides fujianensis]